MTFKEMKQINVERINECIDCLNILKERIILEGTIQEQLARLMQSNSELLEVSLDLWELEQELINEQSFRE